MTAATAIDEDAVRAIARRLLPAADAGVIRVLGAGTDHVAVAVDDTFVLRRAAAGEIRQAPWLALRGLAETGVHRPQEWLPIRRSPFAAHAPP